ncbi:MAG: hypothetical protein WC052_01790 [Patescibacteria group bacterium]|jgi:hypothetical protein
MKLIRYGGFALLAALLVYSSPPAATAGNPALQAIAAAPVDVGNTGTAIIPNGTGKTTTMPALTSAIAADDPAIALTAHRADIADAMEGTALSTSTKVGTGTANAILKTEKTISPALVRNKEGSIGIDTKVGTDNNSHNYEAASILDKGGHSHKKA